jgi:probable HAF family extracellular repeat protein
MCSKCCALLATLLFTSADARALDAASLTPLGDLPGGSFFSVANGISADGSVVVGQSTSASGDEAFRWTSSGGMVGLGFLPGSVPGDSFSQALGVSADGSVIVGESTMASGREAFRWTSGGGMVSLGDLPEGTVGSQARGISADGSVIVGYGIPISNDPEAVRWTTGGGIMRLGSIFTFGTANGVSADGSVIVGRRVPSTPRPRIEAFRWTIGGGMVGLGYLPGGGFESEAYGVSADGSVIVGYGTSAAGDEAFRWTPGGGMVGLGVLPGGDWDSVAYGVNGDGSIVVGFNRSPLDGNFKAFYWTADGGMQALWDVLLSHGVDPAADGWTDLYEARGISADGNTIVGIGARDGNAEAFVAILDAVPEPAAGSLALLGASSILLRRRRSLGRVDDLRWTATCLRARKKSCDRMFVVCWRFSCAH